MNVATLPRRVVLGALAMPLAAPAVSAQADPIFAAIAHAVAADNALTAALNGLDESDDAAMGLANAAADHSSDAIKALGETTPTTTAGLHALIRHYAEDVALQDIYSAGAVCLAHLARVIEARPPP
ncbi:hypothetical protein [Methylobacterium thuringiense]|uniref:Uncharacterized protein n=1 Tax=Methylobacterium thuringiense TaxID=1003091 RepID=A0ABQ4TT72_9HYPH|nr:hypothetical protein [Methylobacterium thuringiense]GJE57352.1 hypothetical protein EKPJFOCH_3866 [Methylobacterium thuringiense]